MVVAELRRVLEIVVEKRFHNLSAQLWPHGQKAIELATEMCEWTRTKSQQISLSTPRFLLMNGSVGHQSWLGNLVGYLTIQCVDLITPGTQTKFFHDKHKSLVPQLETMPLGCVDPIGMQIDGWCAHEGLFSRIVHTRPFPGRAQEHLNSQSLGW